MHSKTILILVCLLPYIIHAFPPDSTRNPDWAITIEKPGLPNLHKINDQLYRGAQPTVEGMEALKKMGIRTVVNLRSFNSDRKEIGLTGLACEHIYMKTWHVEEHEVIRFLQIVTDTNRTPVFFHCMHGSDRTGTMCAIYRIAVQGWSKEEAIEEMTKGRYGYHTIWKNLVPFIEKLDIEKIKEKAGLTGK
jgi:protein tyrosine/serine phosphatase